MDSSLSRCSSKITKSLPLDLLQAANLSSQVIMDDSNSETFDLAVAIISLGEPSPAGIWIGFAPSSLSPI